MDEIYSQYSSGKTGGGGGGWSGVQPTRGLSVLLFSSVG